MDGVRYVSNVVAHNLRTPLGRIRGHLEHALRGKSNYQGLEDAGNYAIEEIDSLTAVLEKLLQIGEAESGTRRRPFESVNLGELVTLVVELYDAAADAQGISLIADVGGNTVVFGDKDLLAIILGNLLDNALKYAGNCATITVRVSRERETVTLVVQDGGPGIPLQEREKVLRRFYRLDNRQLGNGLGLSIVVAFTFLHGGTIQLEDAAPGLRVRITLPFAGVLVSEPD
jgi:signal transduction histidine kinase